MNVVVITGAPGVGKSTLLPVLSQRCPGKHAWVDGDDVVRTRPTDRDIDRLDLVQSNIASLADNFAAWGAEVFFAAWVFPSQERIERMTCLLRSAGHRVMVVGLIADGRVLAARNGGEGGAPPEYINEAAGCNEGVKRLKGVCRVDTTGLTVEQVADAVLALSADAANFS